MAHSAEHERLALSDRRQADWKHWGPYVSERAWGTVREDYSADGDAWRYFTHDHARSRAYRWNEDGIAGVCNRFQNLCMALALWNERDPILKERFFGLAGPEGNHGEDVKEYYFYLDSTPTHSYMKMLYKYPQSAYPYGELVAENRRRSKAQPEYELYDALRQDFEAGRYFDVFVEYAKADEEDLLCRITAINRGPQAAPLHLLPHLWARNTWSWGYSSQRPELRAAASGTVQVRERHLGDRWWYCWSAQAQPTLLFTENDTNLQRLYGVPNASRYVKDGFHEAVVQGHMQAVNPEQVGTKAAAHFQAVVEPGAAFVVWTRFTPQQQHQPFADFEEMFAARIREADEFYDAIHDPRLSEDERRVQRQAFAGLMWSKQFYHYAIDLWLDGDRGNPPPPPQRRQGRNAEWRHLYNLDVISMPDKWEYPWYAAWDLAFHTLPIAMIDPEWAKRQLILMLREWYMHPNGQIPAYEWDFGDVNPPVHAWAVWRVYKIARKATGHADTDFLEKAFHKLLLNFTWWVNRKDPEGRNVFQGGFLGLDNIGVFDRSSPLPSGGYLEQSDSTAWMGMYCLNMLAIALELARTKPAYEDVATKFFEHFIYIANAIYDMDLWDDEDGLFYDVLRSHDGRYMRLKTRSLVSLIPLFAVETLDASLLERLPSFSRRVDWFIRYRPQLVSRIASLITPGQQGRRLLALVNGEKLARVLKVMLDENEFLSPYGLRSLSKVHEKNPYTLAFNGQRYQVAYEPAESSTYMFGGNSNWRGPIWMPVNYLMIESLQKYDHYYGDSFRVAMPSGSDHLSSLHAVAREISSRLDDLFLRNPVTGRRPVLGGNQYFQTDPHWRDYIPFYEYFHGDNGAGLGASHQTGWTALVAKLLNQAAAGLRDTLT
jgi:hypothetical protein